MYEVKIDSTKEEYFELVIHTYSYRQVLRPFDDMALFTVDGLGKIFKLKNWTSRCVSSQVRSSIIVILNKKEFQSIGYAGTVGLKIGTNTFYMPYNTRHYIRQVGLQINSIQETKMMFYNPGSRGTVVKKISLESKVSNEQVSKSELRADTGKL